MLKANEIIILSYINKFHRIDLQAIQKVVNEPFAQLADCIENLYKREYIYCEEEFFGVCEKAKTEEISIWNEWTIEYKEKREQEFDSSLGYTGALNDRGVPKIDEEKQLENILKLQHVKTTAYKEFCLYSGDKIRTIMAPSKKLKGRQRWILYNILEKIKVDDCVHGFVKGRSIKTNAECHINKKEIMCIDIADFFPSIRIENVISIFEELGYAKRVAEKLSELCTFNQCLPQGAPTSPALANAVFRKTDQMLMSFAENHQMIYTRYADDMTFSADYEIGVHLKSIVDMIQECGFNINVKKTHIMKDNYRKIITGLIVRDQVRVPAAYKKKLRQEIYYCKKYGISQHLKAVGRQSAVNFREYLYGKAYFIKMVEKEAGENFLEELDEVFSLQS